MFDSLTQKLGDIFARLGKSGRIGEDDVTEVMREIRVALLEADVALPVVKDFTAKVKERAVGQEVLRSVAPANGLARVNWSIQ